MNKKSLNSFVNTYKPIIYDWMMEYITEDNPMFLYFFTNVYDNEDTNIAILSSQSISKLETIKSIDYDLYIEWTWLFQAINESMTHPLLAYQETALELKNRTDDLINNNKNLTLK